MEVLVARGKAEVEAQFEMVKARREALEERISDTDQPLDETLIKLTNSLTKSIAALSAEQRQLEKHTKLRLDRLSPEDEDAIVREYLRELPRPRRHEIFKMLEELEANNDLLAL